MRTALVLVIVLLIHFRYALCQERSSIVVRDSFADNRNGWPLVEEEGLETLIENDSYIIDLRPRDHWNRRLVIPKLISTEFKHDHVKISFDVMFLNRNGQPYSGVGLVFDFVDDDNFNLLYLGEENGAFFSSIIPCRNGDFLTPIKDGKGTTLKNGMANEVVIEKKIDTYRIFANNKLLLTFAHKQNIVFEELYFTTGKYALTDLEVIRTELIVDRDFGESKRFVASDHRVFILLAGVRYTKNKDFKTLNSPVNDITAMRNFWMSGAGGYIPANNIISLPDEAATRRSIVSAVKTIVGKASQNDVIIIYLTGHGSITGHFQCYDDPLSYEELNSIIEPSKAKNKLVIVDACFSGYVRNIITPPAKDGGLTKQDIQNMFYYSISMSAKNTAYLVSCLGNEVSFDGPTAQSNSTFTRALLHILSAFSNGPRGQLITLSQVFESLKVYFKSWNESNRGKKHSLTYLVEGQKVINTIPVTMTPQLVSSATNNNLPFAIVP